MTNIAGAILAGGKSSRMGEDKADLQLHGKNLLEIMRQILNASGMKDIYISSPNNIKDIIANCGPLSGVHAILNNISDEYDYVLFIPIDMPELKVNLLKKLILAAEEKADLIYFTSHRMPFILKNEKKWLKLVQEILLNENNFSLGYFQSKIANQQQIKISSDEEKFFNNINTPLEWKKFKKGEKV